jgi:hypothetical protein
MDPYIRSIYLLILVVELARACDDWHDLYCCIFVGIIELEQRFEMRNDDDDANNMAAAIMRRLLLLLLPRQRSPPRTFNRR